MYNALIFGSASEAGPARESPAISGFSVTCRREREHPSPTISGFFFNAQSGHIQTDSAQKAKPRACILAFRCPIAPIGVGADVVCNGGPTPSRKKRPSQRWLQKACACAMSTGKPNDTESGLKIDQQRWSFPASCSDAMELHHPTKAGGYESLSP